MGDVLDCIDSDSIDGIVGNNVGNPAVPVVNDCLGLSVEIR
jgi:hypothetical protein